MTNSHVFVTARGFCQIHGSEYPVQVIYCAICPVISSSDARSLSAPSPHGICSRNSQVSDVKCIARQLKKKQVIQVVNRESEIPELQSGIPGLCLKVCFVHVAFSFLSYIPASFILPFNLANIVITVCKELGLELMLLLQMKVPSLFPPSKAAQEIVTQKYFLLNSIKIEFFFFSFFLLALT